MKKIVKILESKNCYVGINKNSPGFNKKKNIRYRPIMLYHTKNHEEAQWLSEKYPGPVYKNVDKQSEIVYTFKYSTRQCEKIFKDAIDYLNDPDVKERVEKVLELQRLKIKGHNTNIKQDTSKREELYQSLLIRKTNNK